MNPIPMSKRPIVCDTTLLLYLGRIERIRLLPALFELIYVPEPVVAELDMGAAYTARYHRSA